MFKVPFPEIADEEGVIHQVRSVRRLPAEMVAHVPEDSPLLLREVMEDCLDWEPARRPCFAQLVQRLEPLESFLALHMQHPQVVTPLHITRVLPRPSHATPSGGYTPSHH